MISSRESALRTRQRLYDRESIIEPKKERFTLTELHEASLFLFQHILHPEDFRWHIVQKYASLVRKGYIRGPTLENALQAKYLSTNDSHRNLYSKFVSEENQAQLIRSLHNIELGNIYEQIINKNLDLFPDYNVKYMKTKNTTRTKDASNITGCPEALWQLQLFEGKNYIGRIGFNFHIEFGKIIISIVNIQGASNQKLAQELFRSKYKQDFATALTKMLVGKFDENVVEFRGLKSEKNRPLYEMTLRKSGIRKRLPHPFKAKT